MDDTIILSVVVCSYNRGKYIGDAVIRLTNQTFDKANYEIIIVDNNSTDNTFDICQGIIKEKSDNNIRYVSETNQGLTFARNRGIKEAKGQIISFIDDDGLCNENYVSTIVRAFDQHKGALAIGGKVIPIFPECPDPKWFSPFLNGILSKIDLGDSEKPFTKKYPVGCNMCFRRQVFDLVGGFNENLVLRSDEKDLFERLKNKDALIMYIPDLVVEHVMSKERVSRNGVIKVSRITGEGEFYRNKHSIIRLILKFLEYIFKITAAVAVSLIFLLKGDKEKGGYLILVGYYILAGFLNAKKMLNPDT